MRIDFIIGLEDLLFSFVFEGRLLTSFGFVSRDLALTLKSRLNLDCLLEGDRLSFAKIFIETSPDYGPFRVTSSFV